MTHDCRHHGAITLCAAPDVLDRPATAQRQQRHRRVQWLIMLECLFCVMATGRLRRAVLTRMPGSLTVSDECIARHKTHRGAVHF